MPSSSLGPSLQIGDPSLAINSGAPERRGPWPSYDKGNVLVDDDDVAAAARAVRSRRLFRYDDRPAGQSEVDCFERRLERYFGTEHALAVSSGTAAIAVGLMAAGLEPGDEVACPGFAFPATPSAILLAGGVPVLVEVDEDLNFDVADLAGRITPRMRAVVVVHMRGVASDCQAVLALAQQHGLFLVEDAVPALGVRLDGRPLGTFGKAGAFSTQSDKSLNSGEGGFLLTDDEELFGRAVVLSGAYEGRYARHFRGTPPPVPELDLPLYNFRMDEVRGAICAAQMDKLDQRLITLRSNYTRMITELGDIPQIQIRRPISPGAFLGEALLFRIPGASPELASWTAAALRAEGVDARAFGAPDSLNVRAFWTWQFLFPGESRNQIRARLPRTVRFLDETIDIPLSPTLSVDDVHAGIRAIRKVCRSLPQG
jgi:dTDP-4-amino-4,6-dideoxygalactose transaminase